MDNMLTWLLGILGTVGIILVVVLLFLSCWCIKVKRRQDQVNAVGGPLPGKFAVGSITSLEPRPNLNEENAPQMEETSTAMPEGILGLNTSV
ncbi:unnamed protein product [Meloidogyne enterolobii]